jgi:hypothetical protein
MTAMTRHILLALAAGATLAISATQTARSAATGACSLLTDAQVKTLIYRGQPADRPEEMTVGRGGAGSACAYSGGTHQLILYSGGNSQSELEADLAPYLGKGTRQPISGVGDQAYIVLVAPQNQYQRPTAVLVSRAGPHALSVVLAGASKESTAESLQSEAVEVAKAAVAKLRSGS